MVTATSNIPVKARPSAAGTSRKRAAPCFWLRAGFGASAWRFRRCYPTFISIVIGTVLVVWAAYALSAAGAIAPLPLQRPILPAIAAVFLVRGIAFPWLKPIFPDNSPLFWLITSGICLLIGSLYALGTYADWERL